MLDDRVWILIAKKLSGEGNDKDLRELEMLLRENPELHYPIQIISDLWVSNVEFSQSEAEKSFQQHMQRLHESGTLTEEAPAYPAPAPKKKLLWPVLAGIFFITAVGFGIHFLKTSAQPPVRLADKVEHSTLNRISTTNSSKTRVVLPDGTKVWLNAGSTLTYDSSYNFSQREVVLSGEGYFDVVKNKFKPFLIHANNINIRVLGTVFNVRSYASDKTTEASLIRGSIEVTFKENPSKKIILKPNEKIVVNNQPRNLQNGKSPEAEQKAVVPETAVKSLTYENKTGENIETSWLDNKLIFKDESFDQIAHMLDRWYGVNIVFRNTKLQGNYLTGSFRDETIRQALDAMQLTASFHYEIDRNNTITIY